jgi:dihydrodipicolinate synthase/N-acetylneuraminate lyase
MIGGVYVANVTPFRDDASLSLNVGAYLEHVRWLGEKGVRGVVPFGTNGEGPSVTAKEKLAVLERLFGEASPMQIIPTVTEGTLPGTLEMLSALEDYPAAAIMVMPPYFYKPATPEGLLRFFEPVVEATRHTVILYHIPRFAVPVPVEVASALPVWGVKDSGEDYAYAKALLEKGKGVLVGTEDDLWRRLGTGAQGAISGLANLAPELVLGVYEAARLGDAEAGQDLSARLTAVRERCSTPALRKRFSAARSGLDLGTMRPPLMPAPEDYDVAPLIEELESGRV